MITKIWDSFSDASVSFDEAFDHFETMGSRLFAEDLNETASVLGALYHDREFIESYLVSQLVPAIREDNSYSSQVFVVRRSRFFTVRLVIWDKPRGVPGEEMFLYEMPHDHDFSFFTMGYFGPGYETEVCSYLNESVVGFSGEKVRTSDHRRWRLHEGRVAFFEGGRDIHTQLPPQSLSISFNVLQNVGAFKVARRQYEFDRGVQRVQRVLNDGPIPLLMSAACLVGGAAQSVVEEIAEVAKDERLRAAAWRSLVSSDKSYISRALSDKSHHVRATALGVSG